LQNDVLSVKYSIGFEPKEEENSPKHWLQSGYIVNVDGEDVGIEVDGPSHFIERVPMGKTVLKRG
jgi:hypothetical protein